MQPQNDFMNETFFTTAEQIVRGFWNIDKEWYQWKFYSYGAIAIRMAQYIYLFKLMQPAIKYIYERKEVMNTKVPFTIIHNISKKRKNESCSENIPRGPRFASETLCGENDTYIMYIIIVGL